MLQIEVLNVVTDYGLRNIFKYFLFLFSKKKKAQSELKIGFWTFLKMSILGKSKNFSKKPKNIFGCYWNAHNLEKILIKL